MFSTGTTTPIYVTYDYTPKYEARLEIALLESHPSVYSAAWFSSCLTCLSLQESEKIHHPDNRAAEFFVRRFIGRVWRNTAIMIEEHQVR